MIQSLYTAASGMTAHQNNIDVIANNLSNINTTGFKSQTASFKDAIYETMQTPSEESEQNNLQQGHGAILSDVKTDFTQGPFNKTGNEYDFAIAGEGFFAVSTNDGTLFTRDGNFNVDATGNEKYLVTKEGYYVMDSFMNRVTISDFEEDLPSRLGVFNFFNPMGLSIEGKNYYATTEVSGQAINLDQTDIKQFHLETSNVDTADQLTRMIRSQRAYQAAARAISTADEMEGMANNIRR